MNDKSRSTRKIAVIGGGISGLAAAHRLKEMDPAVEVNLFEAGDRIGGVLHTVRREDYVIEQSADMFITRDPWAMELCKRIGFDDQLIATNQQHRKAFVVHRGRLVDVPGGFTLMSPSRVWPVLTTPLLSLRGKLRLACECFKPARQDDDDESLKAFATRRFGREVYQRLIQPLIGGIYTADPEQLSMRATMRQFVEMEQQHGSLIRGMRHRARAGSQDASATGARYGLFVTPRDGMSSLIDAISAKLPPASIRRGCRVSSLEKTDHDQWQLEMDGSRSTFDGVILATRGAAASTLLRPVDAELADDLASIQYAGASVVVLGYRRDRIPNPVIGSGFVVPLVERRKILAVSFSSNKFPGRAPDDRLLLRVFVGGACQPELAELKDDALYQLVESELADLLGVRGEPELADIVRWRGAMPQYHVGHLDLVERIERRTAGLPNLELAGNAYRGVGIPFCVRSGEEAAERILNST